MNVSKQERELYENTWSIQNYADHSPGEHNVKFLLDNVAREKRDYRPNLTSILDAGSGSGKGAVALHKLGFNVKMCDITDSGLVPEAKAIPFQEACLWDDLYPVVRAYDHPNASHVDFVYCCDVLEHIPTQFTMLTINQMLRVARYGVFLSISLVPDNFGIWVGQPLHQTVQSFTWWRDNLRELGHVRDARDLHVNAVYFVSLL